MVALFLLLPSWEDSVHLLGRGHQCLVGSMFPALACVRYCEVLLWLWLWLTVSALILRLVCGHRCCNALGIHWLLIGGLRLAFSSSVKGP